MCCLEKNKTSWTKNCRPSFLLPFGARCYMHVKGVVDRSSICSIRGTIVPRSLKVAGWFDAMLTFLWTGFFLGKEASCKG